MSVWAVTADQPMCGNPLHCHSLILLLSPSHLTARIFFHCRAHTSSLFFSEQFPWCFMPFSPFTCNTFDVSLKYTSDPSVRIQKLVDLVVLDLFLEPHKEQPWSSFLWSTLTHLYLWQMPGRYQDAGFPPRVGREQRSVFIQPYGGLIIVLLKKAFGCP